MDNISPLWCPAMLLDFAIVSLFSPSIHSSDGVNASNFLRYVFICCVHASNFLRSVFIFRVATLTSTQSFLALCFWIFPVSAVSSCKITCDALNSFGLQQDKCLTHHTSSRVHFILFFVIHFCNYFTCFLK